MSLQQERLPVGWTTIKVLLVECSEDDRLLIERALARSDLTFAVDRACTLDDGLRMARLSAYDVALLDLQGSDAGSMETLKRFLKAVPDLPIVVISALDSESTAISAVRLGAQEYVVKGLVSPDMLGRIIGQSIYRHRSLRRLEYDHREQALLASRDALTGLANRHELTSTLDQALSEASSRNHLVGLLFIDLDHFKNVNDSHGHAVGDELLRIVARRLEGCVRSSDLVARLAGDEFVIVLQRIECVGQALRVAASVLATFSQRFVLGADVSLAVSASVGVSIFPRDGRDERSLLALADDAMYRAKREGGGRLQLCSRSRSVEVPFRPALLKRTLPRSNHASEP